MDNEAQQGALLFERRLQYSTEGSASDVTIRVWPPARSKKHPHGFDCRFEVKGLPNSAEEYAHGVDGMQALMQAFQGIFGILDPYVSALTWLGFPYDESAFVVNVEDAGRRRRIVDILHEEQYAQQRRWEEHRRRETLVKSPERERQDKTQS